MSTDTRKPASASFMGAVCELVRRGNARRLVVKNGRGNQVVAMPVTAGVVAVVIVPAITATALAALVGNWTVDVEPVDGATR